MAGTSAGPHNLNFIHGDMRSQNPCISKNGSKGKKPSDSVFTGAVSTKTVWKRSDMASKTAMNSKKTSGGLVHSLVENLQVVNPRFF